ncbi:hypothetical protein R9C00_03500 [Flammeovirgaceae bacterium SG7u.111]|nr:hypothetical protein R9C00_03500 [Flammeovirgaceae bacterium SG7u.111]
MKCNIGLILGVGLGAVGVSGKGRAIGKVLRKFKKMQTMFVRVANRGARFLEILK